MDAAHKQQIKDALLAQAQAELAAMRQRLDSEHAAAEVDEEDVSRVDDVSQQDYAGDGAVVAFAGGRYVVGVAAADTFTVGDREQRLDEVH